jgi:membrane fusion protein, multidrug efflux system
MSIQAKIVAEKAVDPDRVAGIVCHAPRQQPGKSGRSRKLASPIALVILVLLTGGIYAAWHGRSTPALITPAAIAPAIELAPSETFLVKRANLRHTVPLSGSLRALNQSYLKAEVGARVSEVLVREGEPVEMGQVLARLDVSDLSAKLNEKLSNLEQAKAQLALAEKTRATKLVLKGKGYATQATVNEVESTYQVQLANVRAIEAQIAVARKALADAVVRAPMDAFVGERNVNPGEKVAIDGKLFTIVDLSEMEIEAMISSNDIGRIAIGQNVEFRVPGLEGSQFLGRVVRINPTVRPGSRSIPVYVQVRNEDRNLRGGMFALGEVIIDRVDQIVAVPVGAVRGDAGDRHVLKLADDTVTKQPITLTGEPGDDGLIAVATGLLEGDTIISAPVIKLDPGTHVRITAR